MKIIKIEFNWTGIEQWGFCSEHELGKKGVVNIAAHFPQGEGDRCYCTVEFEDSPTEIIFNVSRIFQQIEEYEEPRDRGNA